MKSNKEKLFLELDSVFPGAVGKWEQVNGSFYKHQSGVFVLRAEHPAEGSARDYYICGLVLPNGDPSTRHLPVILPPRFAGPLEELNSGLQLIRARMITQVHSISITCGCVPMVIGPNLEKIRQLLLTHAGEVSALLACVPDENPPTIGGPP